MVWSTQHNAKQRAMQCIWVDFFPFESKMIILEDKFLKKVWEDRKQII